MPCYDDDYDDEPPEELPLKEWNKKALRKEVKALRDQVLREIEVSATNSRRRIETMQYAQANDKHNEVMVKLAEVFAQGNWRAVDMTIEVSTPHAASAGFLSSTYERLMPADPWGKVTLEVRQCPPKPEGM